MKKMKRILSLLLAHIILVLSIGSCMDTGITVYAKTQSTYTISITNVNSEVCETIHKNLSNGKSFTLKVKGNEKTAKKLLDKTVSSVRKINKQGIYFKYKASGKRGKYCYYNVFADNAKAYKYGVKFIKRLYKVTKDNMRSEYVNTAMVPYYKKYKNVKDIKLHIIYDKLCYNCATMGDIDGGTDNITADAVLFKLNGIENFNCRYKLTVEQWYSLVVKEWISQEDVPDIIRLNTFEEFKQKIKQYPEALNAVGIAEGFRFDVKKGDVPGVDDIISIEDKMPMTKIMASTCFGELSKANQVYFIAQSGYFSTRDVIYSKSREYGIDYSYDYLFDNKIRARTDFKTPGQGMEKKYKHKTIKGVCSVYANYEVLLFGQLGIKIYKCTDDNINHAWTVIKVKNTAGKTLWVPFDYGIGPAEKLIVKDIINKKYLRTEKMRYRLYLSKVKGAPKKKNFKTSDFI